MKRSIIRSLTVAALSAGSLIALSACDNVQGAVYEPGTPVKVGLICLHDTSSTYDKNFIDALNEAVADLGAEKVVFSEDCLLTGIEENQDCFNAAKDLVKKGCNVIFADSFGHQEYMLKAAEKWPSVQFCHATGTNAKTANLDNYHNAFASIYEGRFLAGVAAGARLYVDNFDTYYTTYEFPSLKVGYVGAYSYAEVKSGYTAWFLGVRAALESFGVSGDKVTMDVRCTGDWYSPTKEADAATALINDGAVLVSQHADSMGAPGVCEDHNPVIPNVTYNISTKSECPNSYIAHSRINWAPYYKAVVNALYADAAIEGEVNHNWTGTMATGSVEASIDMDNIVKNWSHEELATKAELKAQLQTRYNAVVEGLRLGTIKVFDVDTFKVTVVTEGENKKNVNATVDADGHLTAYQADTDGDYAPDTNVIKTVGTTTFFNESVECSAPYFDLDIDGITVVTAAY